MKKLMIILALMIYSILLAQNPVWENPLPLVLGDNIELQPPSIKTSDGSTIFFWSKTELDGRIIYAMKLNEQGEYQWAEEYKIVLEKEPLVTLKDIIKLENNNYVLHFEHQDHKDAPIDHIYTIMNDNGNMLWDEGFSFQDYNDALHPVSQVNDLISGFNVLCHNTDNDESTMIHFDLSGNFTILDVSGYSYANNPTFQMINYNSYYYILYEENSELIFSKLNSNFEPVNTSIIPLNITIFSFNQINLYPFENEFYIVKESNEIVCKISENGNLLWLINLNTSYYGLKSGITVNGDLFILGKHSNHTIDYYLINSNGYIEVESSILQGMEMYHHHFHFSYNEEDKINVIVASKENDIYSYLAQTVDLDGTLAYSTDGLELGFTSELQGLVLNSYPEKFTFLFLESTEDRKINLTINTYNESGTQIIPEDHTVLETSFVSNSWPVCSQYIEEDNNILLAFISNRETYWAGEVYIQKINQSGNLLYEEEGKYLNTYYTFQDIRDIFINDDGFVFIIYIFSDQNQTLKCDVFTQSGEFIRTYTLDYNVYDFTKVYHQFTDNGTIISWFNRSNNTLKIHKFDENNFLWDNPISLNCTSSTELTFKLTENYVLCKHINSPDILKLYKFDDDGSLSPGWENGFNMNCFENLSRIVKIAQANSNFYFIGRISRSEYQLFGINSDQQVLFENSEIIVPSLPDLLVDDNIYIAYRDTTLQCAVVEKYDMSGQNLWSNNALMWDFTNGYDPILFRTGANGLSVLISPNRNFVRFASMDLDGNSFTPFEGEIVTESRGSKRFVSAHEMEYGQIMFIWTDYCVSNCVYDPDYNAIAGRLYDFSALSNDENTIPYTHSYQLSNYPNPFNPETRISFSIPNESEVELTVYNVKGQKVKVLLNDNFEKGDHSIVWDGFDDLVKPVSSGVYLYELNVNGKTEVIKKCLLLK